MKYSAARIAYPAIIREQERLNAHYRALLDNAARASHPVVVSQPWKAAGLTKAQFFSTKEGKTMASKKKAARKRARKKTAAYVPSAVEEAIRDRRPEAPSVAEKLAAPSEPTINAELVGVAQFVAVFLLFRMGFNNRELGELLGCSSSKAMDMVTTGQLLADRNGLTMYAVDLDRKMRAMRENAAADWADLAAKAMQSRIVDALPALVRYCAKVGYRSDSKEDWDNTLIGNLSEAIKAFSAGDVVERSELAKRLRAEEKMDVAKEPDCGTYIGRAGEVGNGTREAARSEAARRHAQAQTAASGYVSSRHDGKYYELGGRFG